MTTARPDLLSLATRFAQLPDGQRKVFLMKLGEAGIDFRMLPVPPRAERAASVPASFAQMRLWLHARMIDEPGSISTSRAGSRCARQNSSCRSRSPASSQRRCQSA